MQYAHKNHVLSSEEPVIPILLCSASYQIGPRKVSQHPSLCKIIIFQGVWKRLLSVFSPYILSILGTLSTKKRVGYADNTAADYR